MDVGVPVNAFYDIFREMTVGFHDRIGCGSFGTACNVSGDNAIGVIVDTIYKKFIVKTPQEN